MPSAGKDVKGPLLMVALHMWHLPCGHSHLLAAGSHHSPLLQSPASLVSQQAKAIQPRTGMPSLHPRAQSSSLSPRVGVCDRLWQAGSWICWRLRAAGASPPPEVAQSDAQRDSHSHTHSARPPGRVQGLCRSSPQLTEPLLLLQLDEDVALVHHLHQLLQDLLLSLLVLRCLQGICGRRGPELGAGKATNPELLPTPCKGILLALTLLVYVTAELLVKLALLLLQLQFLHPVGRKRVCWVRGSQGTGVS